MRGLLKELARQALAQGWRVEYTGTGHWKWYPPPPAAGLVVTSSTPSDSRAFKNIEADLRRHGFKGAQ